MVLLSESRQRHLVWRWPSAASGPTAFHRLLGGEVRFMELSSQAAVETIQKAIGVTLEAVEFVTMIENVFAFDGLPGHEVILIYLAVVPDALVPDEGAWVSTGGSPMRLEWRPLENVPGVPLYPEGLPDLVSLVRRHRAAELHR